METTTYNSDTPPGVRDVLDSAIAGRRRVRIFYGDKDTGRDWLEENDVIGRIGRSTGAVKAPLLIANARSMGGPAILDGCIVRIVDAATKRELYRHPNYIAPTLTTAPAESDGYAVAVYANGSLHAQFKSQRSADNWIAFMLGQRMAK